MATQEYDYTFRLSFHAEWFDPRAEQKKKFLLNFYPCDSTVELKDLDMNRMFLRRAAYDGLRLKDVFVGNTITIYGRQIKLTDYADCRSKNFVGRWKEHTFAMIKPSGMSNFGDIIDDIYNHNFTIERMRMAHLSRKETLDLYEENKGDAFLPFVIEHVSSAPIVAMELVGENALDRWGILMGPKDPVEARKTEPTTFRARFGIDLQSNAVHGARSNEAAIRSACFFFPQGVGKKPPPSTARINNSTCCIIKPHAIDERKLGKIIGYIKQGDFNITALQMFYLDSANAAEFLEVYKGVVADFHALLHSFLDGPCVAMEISGKDDSIDVHQAFRVFCGPADSDIARHIRPKTIRGMFGVDKYRNAVHCTDLKEDTALELEYFFKILDD
ncbi:PREDICTED: nucleoside diphosphate kinase 7 [Nicrophorus vespilloides]|uniref:Nucleoside diphosphate kinase 7 n=1 Tax=Nicrophorus vespilloides TaxID=110193 RepID=A0ABM1NA53_NICVS|nr:PREDICTED: nucleoside diphosphate kinase 7 [Nicrophorus vespilloides]XP_017783704.1 PREDICTED: nucleoside diphosphate kinase 7 [Nicrophorus vespilloides]